MKKILFTAVVLTAALGSAIAQTSTNAATEADASAKAAASTNAAQAGTSAAGNATTSATGAVQGNSAGATAAAANSASVNAVLTKTLDAKKLKQGDEVTAKTTDAVKGAGSVNVPKGTKLIGHVTEVQARGKSESQSRIGIRFDKAILKGGQEVPFHATIQAIAAVQQQAAMAEPAAPIASAPSGNSGANGGLVGGATNTVGGATNTVGNVAGSVGAQATDTVGAAGGAGVGALNGGGNVALTSNSRGVIGMQGVQLISGSSAGGNASIVRSDSANVRLESGTQMMLSVSGQ